MKTVGDDRAQTTERQEDKKRAGPAHPQPYVRTGTAPPLLSTMPGHPRSKLAPSKQVSPTSKALGVRKPVPRCRPSTPSRQKATNASQAADWLVTKRPTSEDDAPLAAHCKPVLGQVPLVDIVPLAVATKQVLPLSDSIPTNRCDMAQDQQEAKSPSKFSKEVNSPLGPLRIVRPVRPPPPAARTVQKSLESGTVSPTAGHRPTSPVIVPNTLESRIQKRKEAAVRDMWKDLYTIFQSDLDEYNLSMEEVVLAEPGEICEILDALGYPYEGIIRRCLKHIVETVSNPASPMHSYISSPLSEGRTGGSWEVCPKVSTIYRSGGDQLEQWLRAAEMLDLESHFDSVFQSP